MQTWFDTDDFATLEKTFLERNRRAPDDYDAVHGLQEVYYKSGKWPLALEWSTRAAKMRPNDAEAQYGVGTFIWQMLASHGGGPDMAAYDPRPRPPPEDAPPAARKPRHQVQRAGRRNRAARAGTAAAAPDGGARRRHGQGTRRSRRTAPSRTSRRRSRCARITRTR